jgi:hypothetical protein
LSAILTLQQFSREWAQTKIEVQKLPEGRKHRLLLMLRRRRRLLRVRLLEMVVREERHGESRSEEAGEDRGERGGSERERERETEKWGLLGANGKM